MLTFIHIAYFMMALLQGIVSTFEDMGIECLGKFCDLTSMNSVFEIHGSNA